MNKAFEHVVIIGCGLLGASLGMALRKRGLAKVVTGVGRKDSSSIAIAQQRGAIDRASDDPAAAMNASSAPGHSNPRAAPPADLVVVCTPVRQFPQVFKQIGPAIPAGAILTDVGSTKAEVMKWANEILPQPPRVHFVGSHPMAGSEKNGPEAAREDLYENGACLICKPDHASEAAVNRIKWMWQSVGMRIIECTAQEHDDWTAAVSHLPHAIASSLVKTAIHDPASLETAANGFIDTSRIASGDVTMWTDILMTNREAVVRTIDRFHAELSALQKAVKQGDEASIHEMLASAKKTRDEFIAKRQALAAVHARTSPHAQQEP